MTAACAVCGNSLPGGAKFCPSCGAPVAPVASSAEYKQVTVLFADIVHSMDIAAAVGPERLREIMEELVARFSTVVQRYGGTVDKFTGDGIMAVFGAPVALEDHAFRACLAASDIQAESRDLEVKLEHSDGVSLQLRVGLNSGEVIAGDIGGGALGYTAIGEQVGMAQRMESIAPPGGVMLSQSTARLVQNSVVLAEPELLHIKGSDVPVPARRLLGTAPRSQVSPQRSILVGRDWELAALTAMLDRSINGHGCVASVVGPAGIGKSRLVAEIAAIAESRGAQAFWTFCESHTSEVPLHASTCLLRAALGADQLDEESARALVRAQVRDADPTDLLLLEDALGIRDATSELPDISPDARRRRLTALVDTIALARTTPSVFVIEDAHWIDASSESLFADFLSVIPRTRSLVLITYRSEYQGELSRNPGAQTIALAPLADSESAELVAGLLGSHPSVAALIAPVAERAAGNPFFAEQIVGDLADRGVLKGARCAFMCGSEAVDVSVPATLQAAIAARVDRLDSAAKRTLNAAAVIGLRFGVELLTPLVDQPAISELIGAELIDQVKFTPRAEYAFRHALIRTVAYRSQLKSDRGALHRRLALAIEQQDPESVDENAALIAEHLQAAGDLREAYGWLMRAGTWLKFRDIKAARMSWLRARDVADRLPAEDPDRPAMRIAPRALACVSSFRVGGPVADNEFDELRELATAADDKRSLAIGMAGQVSSLSVHARYREAGQLASELTSLVESIGDPTLTVALVWAPLIAKISVGEFTEVLRLAERAIDLANGDPRRGNIIIESPLAVATVLRAVALASFGRPGWKDEFARGLAMSRDQSPRGYPVMVLYKYTGVANGSVPADASALRESADVLELAQRYADDFALACARAVRGFALVRQDGPARTEGFELLATAREEAVREQSTMVLLAPIDLELAKEKARNGELDGAIEMLRAIVEGEVSAGGVANLAAIVTALVETLLDRGADADVREAQAQIERLADMPVDPGFAVYEVHLLRMRTLLARARGDDTTYQELRDRYRAFAKSIGFEGHIALAEAM
jgi:adenylate cyclase